MGRTTAGERIHYFRNEKKLTMALLAEMTGISRDALIRYESGQTEPTPEKLVALATAMDGKPDKLCDAYFLFLIQPYNFNLKDWRKANRMTQQKFAAYCGYPLTTVKRWEQGINRVTREQWIHLSALLT